MRKHPHLLEINAWIFLGRLEKKYGKKLTLSSIPPEEWKAIRLQGFDIVWLMGVWQRSPGARKLALGDAGLRQAYDTVLPGWKMEDITGSPYAVYGYLPDPHLDSENDLTKLRAALNAAGLKLFVDFVPNHLALDHPATISHPEYFIQGSRHCHDENPGIFFEVPGGRFLAHGKDPHFLPWTDSVQINFFSSAARDFLISELLKVAETADGVRCDMAMLGLNSVFLKTWEKFLHPGPPVEEFWRRAIQEVRRKYPGFIFMAEVYWGLEWELQQAGFDFTYDKTFYDRLLFDNADSVRGHLTAEDAYQRKSVRFIENHDEFRAASAFGADKSRAAAVVMATVPGLRFFHDGQQEGKKLHIPIQIGNEPDQEADKGMEAFYKILLKYADQPALHDGKWSLLSSTNPNLLAWSWRSSSDCKIIVVNYSAGPAEGKIRMPESDEQQEVRLGPWGFQFLNSKR